MVLRVDILIIIYMILCVCVLAFDLVYLKKGKPGERQWHRGEQRFKKKVSALISEGGTITRTAKKELVDKLHRFSYFMCFHDLVMDYLAEEETAESIRQWIRENDDLLLEVHEDFVDSRRINKKAFFAYLVWQYNLCQSQRGRRFVVLMHRLVLENSMYCRENALWALYVGGTTADVIKAYKLMIDHGIVHSQKLVTDGLLAFRGNKQELAEALWDNRKIFSVHYGVAFINFVRMASSGFEERFFQLLLNEKADAEIRIAAVRYFRSHPYPEASKYMRGIVSNWRNHDWEIVSQSALSLERDIQSKETVLSLVEGAHSTNWYTRKNSAESLSRLEDEELLKLIVINEDDRYANEMVNYIIEKRKEEKK
ncbi:hypothetical protein M2140_001245 [Clostridiales Family XIII bacterium PM5-7]